ncbi:alpha-keto acid decarboxylase family protein [Mammaliicoccus stepanovicii]|uniref:Alpha-keto-acid decarboxylase n=1 Tax=Mammaliicoccus stepanovicii TaxID=643214 RepID=A0A239YDI9_9STAP|nr:alpha-keto acid decarboxylase family protein [Mammaliicoccus stepanovicii]PNZ75507.1 pyruvate decarboxylase [Mammaliicoccus stepanovicii]GGI42555.1 pyruvate decarboxylase [Mammaliicoccus stepanovicii]SNV56288.1 putative indole-3-pyruvate decarboxylase [Mammaliicoccus stepanovicii]
MKKRVGEYLMDSLSTVGVEKVFGVPGDFNLAFLDDIVCRDDMEWIGNTNELNASYAADGYARLNGISAIVTTFGVGELSAVNGIAGAYAERVPVVTITGAPTTSVEEAGKFVHHSLGEGHFDNYRRMYKEITTAQGYITVENAQTEIPRLIDAALAEKRPVHLHLPIDVAQAEIDVQMPYAPAEMINQDVSKYTQMIVEKLQTAKQPVIIAGHEINSFKLHRVLEQFVNQTQIPVAQLSLGKGAFNEENDYYMGIYDGSIAEEDIKDYVNNSDAILNIGAKLTDSATAGYSYEFDIDDVVMINHHDFKMNETITSEISLVNMLNGLLNINYKNTSNFPGNKQSRKADYVINKEPLTQENYFKMIQNFIGLDDVILAEQGTSFFGAYDLNLYKDNTFIGQPLWGSIGYTLPATIGTQMSNLYRRNILLIGDGSLQLTAQDISTMIREDLKPVIFVINNDGYTVERKIHGEHQSYNDIQMWDYKLLPAVFGGKDKVAVHDVETSEDLQETLMNINNEPNRMHFIEVKMHVSDAPEKLDAIGKAFSKQNS